MNDLVEKLKINLLSKNIEIGCGVLTESIKVFEKKNAVCFPKEFLGYLESICGLKEDMYDELATFWAFEKYICVKDYFKLHEKYYLEEERKYPMQVPANEEWKLLRTSLQISRDNKLISPKDRKFNNTSKCRGNT